MKHVIVREEDGGFFLDPRPYLHWLRDGGAESLPPGARSFATDPSHYDFSSAMCVKDLRVGAVVMQESDGRIIVEVSFLPHSVKHELPLTIHYSGVMSLAVNRVVPYVTDPTESLWGLGFVQLDELTSASGCACHEIALTEGFIQIVAQDLTAAWG